MNHESTQSEPQQTLASFEVSFPSDDPYHRLALRGLAKVLGWDIREVHEAPTSPEPAPAPVMTPIVLESRWEEAKEALVTGGDLRHISTELFGIRSYGDTAKSILQCVRDSYDDMDIVTKNGEVRFGSLYHSKSMPNTFIAPEAASTTEIEYLARKRLEAAKAPFTFEFMPVAAESEYYEFHYGGAKRVLQVVPVDVTKNRLAAYMRSHDYHMHELHGQLGKAFDVLNVAADSAPPRVSEEYDAGDFITLTDLVRIAKEQGITFTSINTIMEKLNRALALQVLHGRPSEVCEVEIVIEGQYDATVRLSLNHKYRPQEHRIAIRSLVEMGNTIKPGSKSALFLQRLPTLV